MKKARFAAVALVLALIMAIPAVVMARPMDEVQQRVEDGTAFVPLRLTAYAHGADVEWDGENHLVIITSAHGDIWTVAVEAVGGFIEDGTSWVPYDYAAGVFDTRAAEEAAPQEEDTEDIITVLVNAIAAARLFVEEHSEILEITSFDGYVFQSRLTMPAGDEAVPAIVIDTGTSGPHTYLSMRYTPGIGFWYYFDFYAMEFANNGVAFMSSNTRGVSDGTEPPMFVEIDEEGYLTYTPTNVVEDVYHMIRTVRENPRLADAQIFLLGHSEGASINVLFEAAYPGMADVLLLLGSQIMDMQHTIRWQSSAGPAMLMLGYFFEIDEYGLITEEAFYAGPWETHMGAPFEALDMDQDGFITAEDFYIIWELQGISHLFDPYPVFEAVEQADREWLIERYYPLVLTPEWLADHFAIRTNMEIIPELDLPIYIFHGTMDMNVHVRYVLQLQELLQDMGRTNVTFNIFPGHGHGLDFSPMALIGDVSDGIAAVIDAVLARVQ